MGVEGRSPHPRRAHNYEKRSFVVIVCYNKHALFYGCKVTSNVPKFQIS